MIGRALRLPQVPKAAVVAAVVSLVMAMTSACSSTTPPTTLTVYAAASLTEVFTTLGRDFETSHPNTTVRFNFAGSSDLATQINEGAPADVFASADEAQMERVDSVESAPTTFATNRLTIATAPGNPQGIDSVQDLARSDVLTVLCAPQVPCGAAATRLLKLNDITVKPVSLESSVTDVLAKVASGQADAGLVYVSDVARADVDAVAVAGSADVINRYPIAVLDGPRADLAREFVDLVLSSKGRSVLASADFGTP